MADDDDKATRDEAPDLKILGDEVTFQPSGVEPTEGQDGREEALMKPLGRFRTEPLQFLREVSLYVSGQGWRAYDNVIGQPIFYSGYSENMKNAVLSAPLLQRRISELAERWVAREEKDGWFRTADKDYHIKRTRRRSELEGWLRETAEVWTDKMICKLESKPFIRSAYYVVAQLLTRAYHQGIHVASEDIVMLRKTAEKAAKAKQSIVFLPCHRSHIDYVSLQLICYRLGIALPIVVSGDNLNFPLVGNFLQHAGAMWIRRAFGDDLLYPALVQTYIDTLLQGGFNLECFIEGGRSRMGKLLPPKFGILNFILDSLLSGRVEDTIIIPVSTQYDKVIETEGYVTELLGVPKQRESLIQLLQNTSILSLKLGRVDVRFHEPWSLRGFLDEQLMKMTGSPLSPGMDSKEKLGNFERQKLLRILGYKVLGDINDVSVVMPTALIGTVLLTLRGRGVGKAELMRRVEWLTQRIRAKGGRVAHFHGARLSDVVDRGLEVLGKDLVGIAPDNLAERTYFAQDRFQLSFYRNMTIHLFISEALVSAAMYTRIKQGGGPSIQDISYDDLRAQVLFLSTLFRGEFIFSGEGLSANLDKTLKGLETDQVLCLHRDSSGNILKVGLSEKERVTGREDFDFYCFLIWPFIDASWLAAVSLFGLTPPKGMTDNIWIEVSKAQSSAQRLGKTLYHQGDLSYFEAVNKETLKNAYQRFEEEDIIKLIKSKDPKIPPRLQLNPDWRPSRDPTTGLLASSGRLWDFTDKIASSRREGKNRRDGPTVSTRVMALADAVGRELFEEAMGAQAKGGAPVNLTAEEKVTLKRSRNMKGERRRRTAKL